MIRALPMPPDKTWEKVRDIDVTEGEWRKNDAFVCRTCRESAFTHPYSNAIWGCKKCGYTTASVSLCFMAANAEVAFSVAMAEGDPAIQREAASVLKKE